MTADEKAALAVVSAYLDSYAKKSVDGCLATLATAHAILLVGTNENEVFRSIADVRGSLARDFARLDDIRLGARRYEHVIASDTLASVILELPIAYRTDGKDEKTLLRHDLTLVKEGGQWKICSGIASVPFSAGTYAFHPAP